MKNNYLLTNQHRPIAITMNAYINLETCVIMFQTTCQYLKVDKELKKKRYDFQKTSNHSKYPSLNNHFQKIQKLFIFLVLFVSSMENVSLPQHLHITGTFQSLPQQYFSLPQHFRGQNTITATQPISKIDLKEKANTYNVRYKMY